MKAEDGLARECTLKAVELFYGNVIGQTPNNKGEFEELEVTELEFGLIIKRVSATDEPSVLLSFREVHRLIEHKIEEAGVYDKDFLLEVVPDTILQDLERWRDFVLPNTLILTI